MKKSLRTFFKVKTQILLGSAFLLFTLSACQQSADNFGDGLDVGNDSTGIFGGKEVRTNSSLAKRIVGIRFQGEAGDWQPCTGSWIAPDWILTAAHCLPDSLEKMHIYQSTFLDDSHDDQKSDLQALKLVPHPQAAAEKSRLAKEKEWTIGNRYDLALIKVGGKIKPHLKFSLSTKNLSGTALLEAAGFGLEHYDPVENIETGDPTLKVASLEVKKVSAGIIYINQQGLTGICVGDSGGPLFKPGREQWLVGVASSVRNEAGQSSVCTGESRYVIWDSSLEAWAQAVMKNPSESP